MWRNWRETYFVKVSYLCWADRWQGVRLDAAGGLGNGCIDQHTARIDGSLRIVKDPIVAEAHRDRAEHSRRFIYYSHITELAAGGTGTEDKGNSGLPFAISRSKTSCSNLVQIEKEP